MIENKLTNDELIAKSRNILAALCETGGRSWALCVPPQPDRDPDLLLGELIDRFEVLVKGEDDCTKKAVDSFNIHQEFGKYKRERELDEEIRMDGKAGWNSKESW